MPDANMPRTAIHLDDRRGVDTRELRASLRLYRILGSGSFGVAYEAVFRDQSLVAKLPLSLVRASYEDRRGATLEAVMRPYATDVYQYARENFIQEFRNAEAVLDPPSERAVRSFYNDWAGAPLGAHMDPALSGAIHEARALWRGLPGYAHMHPVVHFDAEIPILLSMPAKGTIVDFRFVLEEDGQLAREWVEVALQLSSAIAFLRDGPEVAHLDVKPSNVFYTLQANGRPHIWLGDYGVLVPMRERTAMVDGSPYFMPDDRLHDQLEAEGATVYQQQLFAYYATLLDLVCFPSAATDKDWLSRTGVVSEGLIAAIRARAPLFTRASSELHEHIMCPLLDGAFSALDALFERTRAWLQRI